MGMMPGKHTNPSRNPVTGTVEAVLPNDLYHVEIKHVGIKGGRRILAHITGKMRMNFVRILPGDRVQVEISPFDHGRGRIVGQEK